MLILGVSVGKALLEVVIVVVGGTTVVVVVNKVVVVVVKEVDKVVVLATTVVVVKPVLFDVIVVVLVAFLRELFTILAEVAFLRESLETDPVAVDVDPGVRPLKERGISGSK